MQAVQRPKYRRFDQNFNFNLRSDPQKNFLWASRLWVGRQKELILSYVAKNDEKKKSGHKWVAENDNFQFLKNEIIIHLSTLFTVTKII